MKEDKVSLGDEFDHLIRCNGALGSESMIVTYRKVHVDNLKILDHQDMLLIKA